MTEISKTTACMIASFALTALILHVLAATPHRERREPDAARRHSSFHPAAAGASGADLAGNGSPAMRCGSGGARRGFLVHHMWLRKDRGRECR